MKTYTLKETESALLSAICCLRGLEKDSLISSEVALDYYRSLLCSAALMRQKLHGNDNRCAIIITNQRIHSLSSHLRSNC